MNEKLTGLFDKYKTSNSRNCCDTPAERKSDELWQKESNLL